MNKKMRRKRSGLLAGALLLAMLAPGTASAQSQEVTVRLPSFAVTVDGQPIDSTQLKYPVLVYRDITYFPMTWNVGQGMGLRTQWDAETGLAVDALAEEKTELAMEQGGGFQTGKSYRANVAAFPVRVNAETIDNGSEPYPLLEFQGITYFPMTWRFTNDSFRWETSWSSETGFAIRTAQHPFFDTVVYDDEAYLYTPELNGRGMYRLPKSLAGLPAYLQENEADAIWKAREQRSEQTNPDRGQELERKDDKLLFRGTELLSLEPYFEKNRAYALRNPEQPVEEKGVFYRSSYVPVDDKTSVLAVTVYYLTFIPGPYTPHETQLFVIRDGKAEKLEGFDQDLAGYARGEGGVWLWSYAPKEMRASNADQRGRVLWLADDGSSTLIGGDRPEQQVEMLAPLGREAVARLYVLMDRETAKEGFFRVGADGSLHKIADLPADGELRYWMPSAYADGRSVYAIGVNGVTEVMSGNSAAWWDYELYRAKAGSK
ncbi:hypothetical protein J31TS4_25870 [Paenibacillus sp. J31TS4]|uniref:hypothetical protein n=1 Tax=Paenibacillus sp. J31TS4 TaxID=2807195 RepID=UPI001B19521E|nr:hypothetical protein [Paenibacillus sp. J31TS4]GIP39307.1 hypothetical protein J31TS4_25870 [Paenibacillus sp. J31TS4]